MTSRRKEFIAGFALIAVAGFYFYFSMGIKTFSVGTTMGVNSKTIPQVYGILLALLGGINILKAWLKNAANSSLNLDEHHSTEAKSSRFHTVYPVILTFLLMITYSRTMGILGFVISSTLYLFFQIIVLTPRQRLTWKSISLFAMISLVSSFLVNYLFDNYLGLHLPR